MCPSGRDRPGPRRFSRPLDPLNPEGRSAGRPRPAYFRHGWRPGAHKSSPRAAGRPGGRLGCAPPAGVLSEARGTRLMTRTDHRASQRETRVKAAIFAGAALLMLAVPAAAADKTPEFGTILLEKV